MRLLGALAPWQVFKGLNSRHPRGDFVKMQVLPLVIASGA